MKELCEFQLDEEALFVLLFGRGLVFKRGREEGGKELQSKGEGQLEKGHDHDNQQRDQAENVCRCLCKKT